MQKAIKTSGKEIQAWRLGDNSECEQRMIREGKIRRTGEGAYEIFSQEVRCNKGETARTGDYFKLDSAGMPYPNSREFFEKRHRPLGGDLYEQLPVPVEIWRCGDPENEVIRYLIRKKSLELRPQCPEEYFRAPLWGTVLSADHRAVLVIYRVDRDERGTITDADFNFVAGDEFEKTYQLLPKEPEKT